jgi:uncharacterized membrane protein YoaK (UPF0700 family)
MMEPSQRPDHQGDVSTDEPARLTWTIAAKLLAVMSALSAMFGIGLVDGPYLWAHAYFVAVLLLVWMLQPDSRIRRNWDEVKRLPSITLFALLLGIALFIYGLAPYAFYSAGRGCAIIWDKII